MDMKVDIGKYQYSEQVLSKHEIIYQTMFEASTDAIFMETMDGKILDCNNAACTMFGYTKEEFLQLNVADLVPDELVSQLTEIMTDELTNGGIFLRTQNRRKDGQVFPVEVNSQFFSIGSEQRVIVYVRDMTERTKAEKVQGALYRISEAAHTSENLFKLYQMIHAVISELMPASNFYIALYDAKANLLSFPYYADEEDEAPPPQKPGRGLTEYILRIGQPLLATPEVYQQLLRDGQVETIGTDSVDWLGVPLMVQQNIIGMMAVQTYTPTIRLTQADQDVLTFVSTQVAMAIERKQAEKALRESELRYRSLFETAPIGILLSSLHGQIINVNQIALDMLGSPSAEATKAINLLTYNPLNEVGFSVDFQRCIHTKHLVMSECPYTSKWGKSIYIRYLMTPILDMDGDVDLIQTIVEDITERKHAEQALQDSEARMRSILETTQDLIYTIDQSKNIQYINHPLAGLSPDTVIGRNVLDFAAPEFKRFARDEIDKVFQSGQLIHYTLLYQLYEDDPRWCETYIGPIYNENNQIVAATLVSRDITERRAAEQKIWNLNQDLARQAEQLTLLYDAGLALNRIFDPREQLEYLAQITIQALHADNSAFFRYDASKEEVILEFGVGRAIRQDIQANFRVHLGEERGFVGMVAQQRRPLYIPDVTGDTRWIVTDPEIKSVLWVPVERDNQLLGILSVASTLAHAFTHADQNLLISFANQVAVSLENARLYQAALDASERSTALHWLSQEIIGASLEPERIYFAIHQAVLKLMPAEAFMVSLLDPTKNDITLAFCIDRGTRYPAQIIPRHRGLSGYVLSTGKSLIIHDLEKEGDQYDLVHFGAPPFVESILAVPMHLGDKIFGVVSAQSYQKSAYSTGDSILLEILAAYAAIALENSRMFSQLQTSNIELAMAYEETIEGWSRALEMRDKETKGHSERVTRLSLQLARAMGMAEEELVHFRRGVLLHDIGKMAIPDSILLKPSSLTEDEWIFMRQHPSYAYQMLADIPFISQALDVPYCHHEKWDGSGYPRGLKGEEIPLGARIFAVVDVWDALINDRPYRPGWMPDVVRSYIYAQAGIYFDPRVVEEFFKILDSESFT